MLSLFWLSNIWNAVQYLCTYLTTKASSLLFTQILNISEYMGEKILMKKSEKISESVR